MFETFCQESKPNPNQDCYLSWRRFETKTLASRATSLVLYDTQHSPIGRLRCHGIKVINDVSEMMMPRCCRNRWYWKTWLDQLAVSRFYCANYYTVRRNLRYFDLLQTYRATSCQLAVRHAACSTTCCEFLLVWISHGFVVGYSKSTTNRSNGVWSKQHCSDLLGICSFYNNKSTTDRSRWSLGISKNLRSRKLCSSVETCDQDYDLDLIVRMMWMCDSL